MAKRLLVVEESLRDEKAHWFEYIKTIQEAAVKAGWNVEVAAHQDASSTIMDEFICHPIFKRAKYLSTNKRKYIGEHYIGFLIHNYRCLLVLWNFFKKHTYDIVFVPTVLIHHLLAWYIIMTFHFYKPKLVTLFFVTPPGVWDKNTQTIYYPTSTVVLKSILKLFKYLIGSKKVVFAVETEEAKKQFEMLTSLPFKLMPHPVPILSIREHVSPPIRNELSKTNETITFSCFGFARFEKGSDLMKSALEELLKGNSYTRLSFILQWIDSFSMPDGTLCTPGDALTGNPQVQLIERTLTRGEYYNLLLRSECMVLPYRNSSYNARVSRVAIEAVCNGIPVIYPKGGWLEENVVKFGAGVGFTDERIDELVESIQLMSSRYEQFSIKARNTMDKARIYYSPDNFFKMLVE